MDNISAIILAAGKGTRMNSELPKVLHKIGDKPMIFYAIEKLQKMGIGQIVIVVSPERPQVKEIVEQEFPNIDFAFQETPLGTGHAVATGLAMVADNTEYVVCLNGDDSAFYSTKTLNNFIKGHIKAKKPISMMTLHINDQSRALGRVVRDDFDEFVRVIEHKEYIQTDLLITEINCGAYIFDNAWLKSNYNEVQPNAITGEFYITELLDMALAQEKGVNIEILEDSNEWVGINTPEELKRANDLIKQNYA